MTRGEQALFNLEIKKKRRSIYTILKFSALVFLVYPGTLGLSWYSWFILVFLVYPDILGLS